MHVETEKVVERENSTVLVVSNRWTGLWTGSLDWITGLNFELNCVYHMTSTQSDML